MRACPNNITELLPHGRERRVKKCVSGEEEKKGQRTGSARKEEYMKEEEEKKKRGKGRR